MKRLLPLLLLGLSACSLAQSLLGTAANVANNVAGATVDPTANNQTAVPTSGSNTTPSNSPSPSTPTGGATTTPTPTASKAITFDTTRKLEYADVWVDMGDPAGQRALVPYLMKPDDWRLVGCEMLSPTSKHYRFMRVSTNDGKSLPQVDIFKQSR